MKKSIIFFLIVLLFLPVAFAHASQTTFSEITASNTIAGEDVTLTCNMTDSNGVKWVVPFWNNTGVWENLGTINASGSSDYLAQFTGTWCSEVGAVVSVKFFSFDLDGTGSTSDQFNFTLTQHDYFAKLVASEPHAGEIAFVNVTVTRDDIPFNNYQIDIEKDMLPFIQNLTTPTFTDSENETTSHTYAVSALYDAELGYFVGYSFSDVTVTWASWLPEFLQGVTMQDVGIFALIAVLSFVAVLSVYSVGRKRKKIKKKVYS
jgi:hypothetical protein